MAGGDGAASATVGLAMKPMKKPLHWLALAALAFSVAACDVEADPIDVVDQQSQSVEASGCTRASAAALQAVPTGQRTCSNGTTCHGVEIAPVVTDSIVPHFKP